MLLRAWPLPALLTWTTAWGGFALLRAFGTPIAWALLAATTWGVLLSVMGTSLSRRVLIAVGAVPSIALINAVALPPYVWILALVLVLLIYPLNAWRDAPLFPTPSHALRDLPKHAPLPTGAQVLDAGCGLGDGLLALKSVYPHVALHGLEWSWPLRALCALRCPWARVRQGDIWKADWSGYDMVYLFQRPESMPRAVAKARAELKPGAWLVSLEFAASELHANAVAHGGRPVWIYRAPFTKSLSQSIANS